MTVYMTSSLSFDRNQPITAWYARRWFRIAPLYYAAIFIYSVEHIIRAKLGASVSPQALQPFNILANIAFVHAFVPGAINDVVPGGWSIGVEMAFYLVAPGLVILARRNILTPLILLSAGAMLLGISWLSESNATAHKSFFYFWPATQFPVFFIGLIFCSVAKSWLFTEQPAPKGWISLALIALFAGLVAYSTVGKISRLFTPTCFGVAFVGFAILGRGPLRRLTENAFTVWLGRISYSLYIVHFGLLDAWLLADQKLHFANHIPAMARLPVVFVFTLCGASTIAVLTKRFVEDPGIRLGAILASKITSQQRSLTANATT